jgi:hypothetical protein
MWFPLGQCAEGIRGQRPGGVPRDRRAVDPDPVGVPVLIPVMHVYRRCGQGVHVVATCNINEGPRVQPGGSFVTRVLEMYFKIPQGASIRIITKRTRIHAPR